MTTTKEFMRAWCQALVVVTVCVAQAGCDPDGLDAYEEETAGDVQRSQGELVSGDYCANGDLGVGQGKCTGPWEYTQYRTCKTTFCEANSGCSGLPAKPASCPDETCTKTKFCPITTPKSQRGSLGKITVPNFSVIEPCTPPGGHPLSLPLPASGTLDTPFEPRIRVPLAEVTCLVINPDPAEARRRCQQKLPAKLDDIRSGWPLFGGFNSNLTGTVSVRGPSFTHKVPKSQGAGSSIFDCDYQANWDSTFQWPCGCKESSCKVRDARCGSDTLHGRAGQTKPSGNGIVPGSVVCTTGDDMPIVTTPDDMVPAPTTDERKRAKDMFARLEKYIGKPVTQAHRATFVQRMKLLVEKFHSGLTSSQVAKATALYESSPRDVPACGPLPEPSCASVQQHWLWRFCARLTGEHVEPIFARENIERCFGLVDLEVDQCSTDESLLIAELLLTRIPEVPETAENKLIENGASFGPYRVEVDPGRIARGFYRIGVSYPGSFLSGPVPSAQVNLPVATLYHYGNPVGSVSFDPTRVVTPTSGFTFDFAGHATVTIKSTSPQGTNLGQLAQSVFNGERALIGRK